MSKHANMTCFKRCENLNFVFWLKKQSSVIGDWKIHKETLRSFFKAQKFYAEEHNLLQ